MLLCLSIHFNISSIFRVGALQDASTPTLNLRFVVPSSQLCIHADLGSIALKFSSNSSYLTIYEQSASLPWYQATIWDPRPVVLSLPRNYLQTFAVFFWYGVFSLTRERVLNLHTSAAGHCYHCHSRVQVPQNLRPYLTVSFQTAFPSCHFL
jgi:hypothetical protein